MTEPDFSTTQTRGKSGKSKPVFKQRKRPETPSDTRSRQPQEARAEPDPSTDQEQTSGDRDPEVIARIQQRAYWLYEAGGFEHGHDLEHWLEAERQVADSSHRPDGKDLD